MSSGTENDQFYSFDESDSSSIELYESHNTSEFTIHVLVFPKLISVTSQDSEFDINEDEDGVDTIYEVMLDAPLTKNNKRILCEGSVPNLSYECLTTKGIFERMLQRVDHLQPIFAIPSADILILLQHYDWNEERLLEVWTEKMDELLVELGLSTTANIKKDNDYNSHFREVEFKNDFTCIICCDKKDTETFALECGHEYCINCYRHYIKDKLHEGNIITCMDCSLALKNEDIDKVMGHPSSSKLMDSSIKSFVQKHNRNYKWCPFADCKSIVHLRDTSSLPEYTRLHYSPFVKCNSFHRFCFNCGFEVHSPADCKITTAWVKKARKESEILNWVLSHTKECPKCSVNIEKNGGCNHMVCSSCKYEFCWICEGPWAPHGKNFFQCTMYKNNEDNKSKNPQDANKTLKKYTFYYRLFNEHEVSAKLDWNLGQTLGTKVHALQERIGISWIDGQFLSESLKVLNEGRTVLKWSFAVAYYSDASHNLTKIFVDNQMLLANAVESLSELLQIKTPEVIMKRRPEFYNKAGYVENRTTALMECGRELLCKGICKAAE